MLNRLSPSVRGFLAGLVVMAALFVAFTAMGGESAETIATQTTTTSSAETQPSDADAIEQFSDLDVVFAADLPNEALDTLNLIADGGPYPFRQDDGVFQNREGILPDQQRGYYREYTVITPSSDDRGARRIVAGADGDLYYTADHYDSFKEIVW